MFTVPKHTLALKCIFMDHRIMTAAKVFMNGRSQAVRLPKEFRVSTDEVFLKKTSEGFLVIERDPWEIFDEGCREISEDFLSERVQPPVEKRAWSK